MGICCVFNSNLELFDKSKTIVEHNDTTTHQYPCLTSRYTEEQQKIRARYIYEHSRKNA